MNRRGFFKTLAMATAGFTILPPATTYQRVWKATVNLNAVNPEWVTAPREISFLFNPTALQGDWKFITDPPIRFALNDGSFVRVRYDAAPKAA